MEGRQEGNKPKRARIFTQAWACMQDRQRPTGTSCLRGEAGDFDGNLFRKGGARRQCVEAGSERY